MIAYAAYRRSWPWWDRTRFVVLMCVALMLLWESFW